VFRFEGLLFSLLRVKFDLFAFKLGGFAFSEKKLILAPVIRYEFVFTQFQAIFIVLDA
jgi:hypothetical protein